MSRIITKHLNVFSQLSRKCRVKGCWKLIQRNKEQIISKIPYCKYLKNITYITLNEGVIIGLYDEIDYTKKFNITMMDIITDGSRHSNCIIIDTEEKTIERFEPHGWCTVLYDWNQMEEACIKMAERKNLKYIPAKLFHRKYGPQVYDSAIFKKTGYCFVWSLVYINMRVAEPDMGLEELYTSLVYWSQNQTAKNNIAKITQVFSMMIHTEKNTKITPKTKYQPINNINLTRYILFVMILSIIRLVSIN